MQLLEACVCGLSGARHRFLTLMSRRSSRIRLPIFILLWTARRRRAPRVAMRLNSASCQPFVNISPRRSPSTEQMAAQARNNKQEHTPKRTIEKIAVDMDSCRTRLQLLLNYRAPVFFWSRALLGGLSFKSRLQLFGALPAQIPASGRLRK